MYYINSLFSVRKDGLKWFWPIIFTGENMTVFLKKLKCQPLSTETKWKVNCLYIWPDSPTSIYFIFHRINWQWHLILLTGARCSDLWNRLAVHAEKTKVHWYPIEKPKQNVFFESQMTWNQLGNDCICIGLGLFFKVKPSEYFISLYHFMPNTLTLTLFKGMIELCIDSE